MGPQQECLPQNHEGHAPPSSMIDEECMMEAKPLGDPHKVREERDPNPETSMVPPVQLQVGATGETEGDPSRHLAQTSRREVLTAWALPALKLGQFLNGPTSVQILKWKTNNTTHRDVGFPVPKR